MNIQGAGGHRYRRRVGFGAGDGRGPCRQGREGRRIRPQSRSGRGGRQGDRRHRRALRRLGRRPRRKPPSLKPKPRTGPRASSSICAGIGVAKRVVGRDGPQPLGDFAKVINVNLIGSFKPDPPRRGRDLEARAAGSGERGVMIFDRFRRRL